MNKKVEKIKVVPYGQGKGDKTSQVCKMFDNISPYYDFLNDLLSLGFGRVWRNRAVKKLLEGNFTPLDILDVACGTGDFALNLYKKTKNKCKITATDISEGMLKIARKKASETTISFICANAEQLPFPSESFDGVSCSYGIRNFDSPSKGLAEFYRVLRKSGRVVIVELSTPRKKFFGLVFRFYFRHILPFFGGIVSKDRSAYSYLPKSVESFPSGKDFLSIMSDAGFVNCNCREFFGGVATLYFAEKL